MERELPSAPLKKGRLTRSLVLVTLIAAFGSSFQYGYNLWVLNHPAMVIQYFYNITYHQRTQINIDGSLLSFLWDFMVSFFPIGGLVGSLLTGPLADSYGRKGTLLINSVFSIMSTVLMGCSKLARTYEFIVFAHMIVGVCAGISSSVVPMYLAEVAPHNLRGGIVLMDRLFFTVGILVAQIVGLQKALGDQEGWVIMVSLTGIPAVFQMCLLPFCPESPRYLLIQKRDEEKARQVLKKLRGWDDVEDEIEELYLEDICDDAEKHMSPLKLIGLHALRSHLFTEIVMLTSHQLSGIHLVYFYMERIYTSVGVQQHDMWYIAMPVTMFLVLVTVVMIYVIDFEGRRFPLLLGLAICGISCLSLTVCLELQSTIPWMSYFSTAFIIIFLFGQAIGPGTSRVL
ncbi:solute carrier family 2, facilitated glucose transporter member 5-like [Tiliqua scincoides]|uniref:solute carrier family 2, facilitated glucose transporter member 5-like n=1 Tax=Tiliqua scincoides TaxID=71010 RepID=UPI003461FAAE